MATELTSALTRLEGLSLGFRARYLGYDDLTRQLHAWAEAFPDLVRVESLGETPEGRRLWLLTIGSDLDAVRPAVWVDGNMHASELAGSSVSLAIAEDVIRAHLAPEAPCHDLPAHAMELVRGGVQFHVLPRMSPDGAERVLQTGAWVRSTPRDARLGRSAPFWRTADVDGDGQARVMRREDPAGDFVRSSEHPDLMLPRRLEDSGPFYALYPEGFIENWDGFTVPMHDYLSDNDPDLNRNFPHAWAHEPLQRGAGAFPASEPESRAVVEFVSRRPNLFAWINFHTYGGVYIRPAGDKGDRKMEPSDLALYRQLGEWAEQVAGYPMVSGFEEFTYEPDKPLHGDLSMFAYATRGVISSVCELWDLFRQAGLEVKRPFIDNYQRRSREDLEKMARWDRDENQGRVFGSWRLFEHPQLGPVEIGGYDPRFGIWNPPPERLAGVCADQARFVLRLASLAPRLRFGAVEVTKLSGGLRRIDAVVENVGYLPTSILQSSIGLSWNQPVRCRLELGEGVALVAGPREQLVGRLGGWGGFDKTGTPALARSSGELVRARVSFTVEGEGRVRLVAGSARTGSVEAEVELG